MKKQAILIISILVVIGVSLILITQYPKLIAKPIGDRKYTVSRIDLHDKQDYFKPGIYYQYNFSRDYREYSKSLDIESIFEELVNNNIPIEEAWHKGYASACCPPGGNVCMEAIVPPAFIVRLSNEDPKIEQFGFIKTDNPNIGWCAYSVAHYVFY